MSDPKNYLDYFSKVKEGMKNFEYRAHTDKLKEKLSNFQNKTPTSEYFQRIKDFREKLQSKLQNEKTVINNAQNNQNQTKNNQKNQINQPFFTKMFIKTKDFSSHVKNSLVEGKIKDDVVDLAKNLKNYEYSKKLQEISQKTQEKIKEADIPEKIKTLKDKANETAKNYQIKEKMSDFSEKSKDTAKILAGKSKENFEKTSSFIQSKWSVLGGKFRNFGRQKARNIFMGALLVIFVYGFSTNLPRAYYDYQRYVDERELRREKFKSEEEKI